MYGAARAANRAGSLARIADGDAAQREFAAAIGLFRHPRNREDALTLGAGQGVPVDSSAIGAVDAARLALVELPPVSQQQATLRYNTVTCHDHDVR